MSESFDDSSEDGFAGFIPSDAAAGTSNQEMLSKQLKSTSKDGKVKIDEAFGAEYGYIESSEVNSLSFDFSNILQ